MSTTVEIEEFGWGICKGPEGVELMFHYDDKDDEYIYSTEATDIGNFKVGKAYFVSRKEHDFYGCVCRVEIDFDREIELDDDNLKCAECMLVEEAKTAMHVVIQHGADDVELWSVDLPMSLFEAYANDGANLRGSVSEVMMALRTAIKAAGRNV